VPAKRWRINVDFERKKQVRKELMDDIPHGIALCPFFGKGDLIAEGIYGSRKVIGIEIDPVRVAIANDRFPDHEIIQGDAEKIQLDLDEEVSILDLDAWVNPYIALVHLVPQIKFTDPFVIFGTDGLRTVIYRRHVVLKIPSGEEDPMDGDWRTPYDHWWDNYVLPFIKKTMPFRYEASRVMRRTSIYWGAVFSSKPMEKWEDVRQTISVPRKLDAKAKRKFIRLVRNGMTKTQAAREIGMGYATLYRGYITDPDFGNAVEDAVQISMAEKNIDVENALYEAALAKNITAIQVWLYNRDPDRWADRRTVKHDGTLVDNRQQSVIFQGGDDPLKNVPFDLIMEARALQKRIELAAGHDVDVFGGAVDGVVLPREKTEKKLDNESDEDQPEGPDSGDGCVGEDT